MPVRPGRTEQRAAKPGTSSSFSTTPFPLTSISPGRSARGPTKLMSPRKMFHNCGSSSIAVARRIRPMRVTRGSFCPDWIGPVSASASTIIDRNFNASKRRPLWPTRSCENNTAPPSSILMSAAITTHSGAEAIRPLPASAISSSRFAMACHCHHVAIQRERLVNHAFERKRRPHSFRCRVSHRLLKPRIGQQTPQGFPQSDRIARRDDVSRFAVAIHPSNAGANVGAHDRFACRHCFELNNPEGFLARHRRQHEHIACPIQRRKLIVYNRSQKFDTAGDIELSRSRPEYGTKRSGADNQPARLPSGECLEQHVDTFDWNQHPDEQHDRPIQLTPDHRRSSQDRVRRFEVARLDAERNDRALRLKILQLWCG